MIRLIGLHAVSPFYVLRFWPHSTHVVARLQSLTAGDCLTITAHSYGLAAQLVVVPARRG